MSTDWVLSVDFGTTNTAAAWSRGGGEPTAVRLSDEGNQMRSAVLVSPSGIRVGTEAVRSAVIFPAGYEPAPKRLVTEGVDQHQLAGADHRVVDLVAAVLETVVTRAALEAGGGPLSRLVMTCPEQWGSA